MFLGLWSACCNGRGWGKFYRSQCAAAIPDLEIAWRHERSPILVGGPRAKPINIALLMAHFFGNKISFSFAITAG